MNQITAGLSAAKARVINSLPFKAKPVEAPPPVDTAHFPPDIPNIEKTLEVATQRRGTVESAVRGQKMRIWDWGRGGDRYTKAASQWSFIGGGALSVAGGIICLCGGGIVGGPMIAVGTGIAVLRWVVQEKRKQALYGLQADYQGANQNVNAVTQHLNAAKAQAVLQFRTTIADAAGDGATLKKLAADGLSLVQKQYAGGDLVKDVLSAIAMKNPEGADGLLAATAGKLSDVPYAAKETKLVAAQQLQALTKLANGVEGPSGVAVARFGLDSRPVTAKNQDKRLEVQSDLNTLKTIADSSDNPNDQLLAKVARAARKALPDLFNSPASFMWGALCLIRKGIAPGEPAAQLLSRYALSQIDNLGDKAVFGFSKTVLQRIAESNRNAGQTALARAAADICDTDASADAKRAAIKLAFDKINRGPEDAPPHKTLAWYGIETSLIPTSANGAARQPLYMVMRQIGQVAEGPVREASDAARLASSDSDSPQRSQQALVDALRGMVEGSVAAAAKSA